MTTMRLLFVCFAALAAACKPAVQAGDAQASGDAPASSPAAAPGGGEAGGGAPDVEYIAGPGMENLDLPFSSAVRVGHTLYLSGMIGNLPGTLELAPGGIQGETRQALENIKATLEHAGSSMDRVVKCTVFLADMSEWQAMNEVYVTYFDKKPARSAFGASGIALDGRVEIECIATVG
jgi:reactive intermediate/imine deaminase